MIFRDRTNVALESYPFLEDTKNSLYDLLLIIKIIYLIKI